MLTYDFSKRESLSLYEYLYKCIRDDIIAGNLKAGEKLPSKREMSAYHDISVITVQNAYEQLVVEGYIDAIEKRGYFVADIKANYINEDKSNVNTSNTNNNKSTINISNTNESEKSIVTFMDDHIKVNFTNNGFTDDMFPYSIWSRLIRRNLMDSKSMLLAESDKIGSLSLREAISKHLYEYRGLAVNPANIIIGAGTEYLYGIIVQLLGRNGMIAVEDPGHLKVSQVYEMNGVKVLHIPVDKEGLLVNKLGNNRVSAVHITPSHHFPTGVVMPASRRHELLNWAKEHNCMLIEDDYDSEFRFQGKPIPTLASLDPEKVIYMNTFSKTLTPSIRIAYMVLPDSLMAKYKEKLGFYSGTVSSIEQYTLADFIKEGYYERHINRMRNYYKQCRAEILTAIDKSNLNGCVKIKEDSAGLHFLLKFESEKKDSDIIKELADKGIKIRSVNDYCYHKYEDFDHSLIINYSSLSMDIMVNAFNDIYQVIFAKKTEG